MNKSRHVVAAMARRLASAGHVVLVPDLGGTGESATELAAATWDGWVTELAGIVDLARTSGATSICLWGLRLGCLLAADVAQRLPEPPQDLLLWQPVYKGAQQMTQFLRLLTAAEVTGARAGAPGTGEAKERLQAGEVVEVAGYALPGVLYDGISAAELHATQFSSATRVTLFEVVATAERPLTAMAQRQVESWREQGVTCNASTVPGDPFWSTQELGFAPALIEASTVSFPATPAAPAEETVWPYIDSPAAELGAWADVEIGEGLSFDCAGAYLAGRLHRPDSPSELGLLIVVGGPQYRAGSHRQFLYLARAAAQENFATLRFDYRGLGDSGGELKGFADIGDDIRSAIDALQAREPAIRRVVLWGLCDAATAAAAYAPNDERVAGLVLANPWVYSTAGAAQVRLKRYYLRRLITRDFWKKLGSGRVSMRSSVGGLLQSLRSALAGARPAAGSERPAAAIDTGDLVGSVAAAFRAVDAPVLLLLSGEDYTAAQFEAAMAKDERLVEAVDELAPRVRRVPDADHTFARDVWCRRVEGETLDFLRAIEDSGADADRCSLGYREGGETG